MGYEGGVEYGSWGGIIAKGDFLVAGWLRVEVGDEGGFNTVCWKFLTSGCFDGEVGFWDWGMDGGDIFALWVEMDWLLRVGF